MNCDFVGADARGLLRPISKLRKARVTTPQSLIMNTLSIVEYTNERMNEIIAATFTTEEQTAFTTKVPVNEFNMIVMQLIPNIDLRTIERTHENSAQSSSIRKSMIQYAAVRYTLDHSKNILPSKIMSKHDDETSLRTLRGHLVTTLRCSSLPAASASSHSCASPSVKQPILTAFLRRGAEPNRMRSVLSPAMANTHGLSLRQCAHTYNR